MLDPARNKELCIHPNYRHRENPAHFDDRNMRDEWQNDVYAFARSRCKRDDRVLDFGCGSGFKLMKYLSGHKTLGYEIEPSLSHLREMYPDREWSGEYPPRFVGDVLICADVIEHMQDPSHLMRKLADSGLREIILSTPALDILVEQGRSPRLGPPNNESHVNEWTVLEFNSYVSMYLHVMDHIVMNAAKQSTQVILARPKGVA
jgi:hypothetical protein